MKLTPQQRRELETALLSAFPERTDVERLVLYSLNENLANIVGNANQRTVIFELVGWCISKGKLQTLLDGAKAENPDNPELKAFFQNFKSDINRDEMPECYPPKKNNMTKAEIQKLIADTKTKQAIEQMKIYCSDMSTEILTIEAKYNSLKNSNLIGIISNQEYTQGLAQVNYGLLSILNECKSEESENIEKFDVEQISNKSDKRGILIITASPKHETEQELIDQTNTLKQAQKRKPNLFATPKQEDKCNSFSHLRKLVEENVTQNKLVLLHISMHGKKEPNVLVFEDKEGFPKEQLVVEAASQFGLLIDKKIEIEFVVISACHSNKFAQKISEITKFYAVGMNNKIIAGSAVNFLSGLYDDLLQGEKIEIAFKAGIAEMGDQCTDGIIQSSIPELYFKGKQVNL